MYQTIHVLKSEHLDVSSIVVLIINYLEKSKLLQDYIHSGLLIEQRLLNRHKQNGD